MLTGLAEQYAPLETGGVLLGWRKGPDRVVTAIVGPGPRALHGRHMFLPDHVWQIAQIDEAFARSNGDLDYLGDWHTHPDGAAALSELDRKTLHKLGRKTADSVMAIAAPAEGVGWTLAAWRQPRGRWLDRPGAAACELVYFSPEPGSTDWQDFISGTDAESRPGAGRRSPLEPG
ncbi:Mov34/MPN/PAD-1 family protein [Brevundimonas sp.]|uniref:Mov34/MPN/PAD-1 family protein n=1 Tax=Brevundimonas sp. TaxID=1871086 RepID=UPI003F6E7302